MTGTAGARRSELSSPYGIRVTSNGTMYIMDTSNYRVLRWQVDEPLGYIVAGGSSGTTLDRLGTCYSLAIDSQRNIYVSDSSNHRVALWRVTNMTSGILVRIFNNNKKKRDSYIY